jgi:hypothetical protein
MEKLSWTEKKKKNDEVLWDVGEERILVKTIMKKKKNWIRLILRSEGLVKDVLEGRMERKKPRERKRIGMFDNIEEGSYVDMKRR